MTRPTTEPERVLTHYCDWDAPGRRLVRALCGRLIQRRDHDNAPTCETCRAIRAERVRDDAKVSDR